MGNRSFFRCQLSCPRWPVLFKSLPGPLVCLLGTIASALFIGAAPENFSHFFKPIFCRFVAASSTRVLIRFSSCFDSRQSLLQCDSMCCSFSRHNRSPRPRLRAASRCNRSGWPGKKTAARGSPLAAIGVDYNRSCSLPKPSNRISDY